MNPPLPSEILFSLQDKFKQIDENTNKKIISGSKEFIALDKTIFFLASGSLIGVIGTAFVSVISHLSSSTELLNPGVEMSLLSFSSALLVGSATIGLYHDLKAETEKQKIKKAVLTHQYNIQDSNEIKHYLDMNEEQFHKKFKDAIYTKEIEKLIDNSMVNKCKNNISLLRNKHTDNLKNSPLKP